MAIEMGLPDQMASCRSQGRAGTHLFGLCTACGPSPIVEVIELSPQLSCMPLLCHMSAWVWKAALCCCPA